MRQITVTEAAELSGESKQTFYLWQSDIEYYRAFKALT
jgi:hypothetical protein